MANNDLTNSENLFIKTDENNLIYFDPNSVIVDNEVQPRSVPHENLVMFVNLEADIIPRTTLVSGERNTIRSISKGTLNFLSNNNGEDYDTTWSDPYTPSPVLNGINTNLSEINSDSTGQSFGIKSVSIQVKGANLIPQIVIEFIDVRGKTLFESPENSPYNAFFHIPWPIFYLTVKGYFGKAIRYRLHLVSFSSKYNGYTGNFEITTKFVGSTYAYMNDIPLKGILNAPYMFLRTVEGSESFNSQTGFYTKKALKSSKGYQILKSVYSEMKQKKLLPDDFPVKTLREICALASTLDKTLEQQIFNELIDPKVLDGLREYSQILKNFEIKINAWKNKNLDLTLYRDFVVDSITTRGYGLKGNKKDSLINITGGTNNNSLEFIINTSSEEMKKSQKVFNDNALKNGTKIDTKLLSNTLPSIDRYFKIEGEICYILHEKLISDLNLIKKIFFEQNIKVEKEIEKKMNTIIKDPTKGFGFEPTIRNLFGVLMANAEVYVRLLKDVHNDAFNQSEERKNLVKNFTDETVGEAIYPWPEIKKSSNDQNVIAYPGEPELQDKLKSTDATLWPEVSFVEEFLGVSTNIYDTLVEKEGGVNDLEYVFDNNQDESKIREISTLYQNTQILPYSERTLSSFLYQIYERALHATLADSFDPSTIHELANIEFETIQDVLDEEIDILEILKNEIKSVDDLKNYMESTSRFEKYQYFLDNLPTTNYIQELVSKSHYFEQYKKPNDTKNYDLSLYEKLDEYLINYRAESYRKSIFPFNSNTYLSYINKEKFTDDEFKFGGLFRVGKENEFISSPKDNTSWLKNGYKNSNVNHIFNQNLTIGGNKTNILNTPYFHKQLFSDFTKTSSFGKYSGSAYLLLNSLPYLDLKDEIELKRVITSFNEIINGKSFFKIRMSSLFREIGGVHYIPYHLLIKWGSIYHRYKKYTLDGVDIINGFTVSDVDTTTTNIDGELFFNNNETGTTFQTFTFGSNSVTYSGSTDVGIHPYYDAIYHQIINGYNHYIVSEGNSSYSGKTSNGSINGYVRKKENGINYWSQYVDNSKYYSTDNKYTIMPCDGYNNHINLSNTGTTITSSNFDFETSEQNNFRILWTDEYINNTFSGKTFFKHDEYNVGLNENTYSIETNQVKVYDLIGTFSPQILDDLEQMFLQFSSELLNVESVNKKFENVKYDNFQTLLSDIVKIDKMDSISLEDTIKKIKNNQQKKLFEISNVFNSDDNLIKFTLGNPKELEPYTLNGYIDKTKNWGTYDISTQSDNIKYLKLYIGDQPDNDISYLSFFEVSNIALTEENILLFRPLILIYGGYIRNDGVNAKDDFINYLNTNILNKSISTNQVGDSNNRLNLFLTQLISKFPSLTLRNVETSVNFVDGYNNRQLKIELYNTFKSFNDKWIAGNSLGQRLLFEEFLFLDKANRDIGSKTYLNISKFTSLVNPKNDKIDLYNVISLLLSGTGFDMRALPSYVNFYGSNITNRSKITPSKKITENIFGTFLDVDYEESSPKIIVQFVGPSSKHLSDLNKKNNKFNDDSFDIGNRNRNPLIVTLPELYNIEELNKSNKVVAFEVNIGDTYQNIFKGVSLDQTTLKNTSESFVVLENLARSESGTGTYNVDVSLFDYYKQASYSCEVTCMGNVMLQPTMYFYLKNVPMFRGTYWITEVSHNIIDNKIETVFKGTRIPVASLPNPEDSFVSSYRSLLDKIINSAKITVKKQELNTSNTEITIKTKNGNFVTDIGDVILNGTIIEDSGITEFGVPYNGFGNEKYIQKINYKKSNGETGVWYRARVARMGEGSKIYELSDSVTMSLLNNLEDVININSKGETGLTWGELKSYSDSKEFYSLKFQLIGGIKANKIITGVTELVNPKNNIEYILSPSYSLDRKNETLNVSGPVNIGPYVDGYGIALSNKLMKNLKIQEGEYIYFNIR